MSNEMQCQTRCNVKQDAMSNEMHCLCQTRCNVKQCAICTAGTGHAAACWSADTNETVPGRLSIASVASRPASPCN
eukprot:925957-Rhodomonas_salina.1